MTEPTEPDAAQTWWLYIIETASGKLYTGITLDVLRRYQQHCEGPKAGGARYFSRERPARICYQEAHPDRSSASKAEYRIKRLSRKAKLALIDAASSQPV